MNFQRRDSSKDVFHGVCLLNKIACVFKDFVRCTETGDGVMC